MFLDYPFKQGRVKEILRITHKCASIDVADARLLTAQERLHTEERIYFRIVLPQIKLVLGGLVVDNEALTDPLHEHQQVGPLTQEHVNGADLRG